MKIGLLDDKKIGISQIKNALGADFCGEFFYFSSAAEFFAGDDFFDIIFLDFFLDRDGITADAIFSKIRPRARKIVAFSSSRRGNEILKKAGADAVVEKIWGEKNVDLENYFFEFFPEK